MADAKDKTDWSTVGGILSKKETSQAVVTKAVQVLETQQNLPEPPGFKPEGVIAQYKANKLQKKAALEAVEVWYAGQLEMARHAVTEAVRVRKAEASKVAEQLLMALDAEHLEYLASLGLRNVATRNQTLKELGDQTSQTMREIQERDWPPFMIEETLTGIIDMHRKFFARIMEDLGSERKP